MRKSCAGDPGHPLPRGNFTARLHGKKLSRVKDSKLTLSFGRLRKVSKERKAIFSLLLLTFSHSPPMLCVFRVGPSARVNVFTWRKVGPAPRVTLVNRVTGLPPGSPYSPRPVVICHVNARFDLWRNVWIVSGPRVARGGGWPGSSGQLFLI